MRQAGAPVLIVDGSNICRARTLLAEGAVADWALVDRLREAMDASPIHYEDMYLIVDNSLLEHIDADARSELRALERAGRAERRSFADERMLELAFGATSDLRGALIASLDHFDDFRRRYPELQGCTDRVIGWSVGSDDQLQVAFRDLGNHTHHLMSRKEEEGELKARRIRREAVQQRAVATYFRCTNSTCLLRSLWPDKLPELPAYDDRRDCFVCPSCDSEVEAGGPRNVAVQFIVFLDGDERFRILLEEGETIDIGRSDHAGCVGLERRLPPDRTTLVSRQHLRISLRGAVVYLQDLGSKNGSTLQRRLNVATATGERLMPGHELVWELRDMVELPGGISIERSGRRLPLDGERASTDAANSSVLPPTRTR